MFPFDKEDEKRWKKDRFSTDSKNRIIEYNVPCFFSAIHLSTYDRFQASHKEILTTGKTFPGAIQR